MDVAPLRPYGSGDPSHMNPEFQRRLANLIAAAPPEVREHLGVYSGYRSQEKQDKLFADAVKKYGTEAAARKWVGKVSEHTSGFAADLGWDGASLKPAPRSAIKWLHDNAGNYGLHFPLPNENWHIEPVEVRATGQPVYDIKLPTYPGLSPIAGHPVPPADIPGAGLGAQPMVRPAAFSPPPPRSRPDFGIAARPMTEAGGKLSPQQVANLYAGILPPQPPKYGFNNAPASFGTPTVGGLSSADNTPGGFVPSAQTWDGRYATDPRMSQLGQPARTPAPMSAAPTLAETRAEQMQMRAPQLPAIARNLPQPPAPPPQGMFPARPAGPPAGMPPAPPQPPQMDPISGQPISLNQFQDFLATGTPSTPPMPMARPPIPTSAPMPRPMPQQQGGGNGAGGTYTVQPGDTLDGIAAKLGTTTGRLAATNGIVNPNQIMAGQRLSTGGGGQGYVPTPIARPMQAAMPPPPVPMNRPGALGGGGFLSGPPGQVDWNVADPGMGGLNGWQYGQPHQATAVGTALSVRPAPQRQQGGGGGGGGSSGGTIYSNPTKYGATQEERNAAAAHREWLANL